MSAIYRISGDITALHNRMMQAAEATERLERSVDKLAETTQRLKSTLLHPHTREKARRLREISKRNVNSER